MDNAMHYPRGSAVNPAKSPPPAASLLVLLMVILFVGLTIVGFILINQISLLETESVEAVSQVIQGNRTLLLVLGLVTFSLMAVLAMLLIALRRPEAAASSPTAITQQVRTAAADDVYVPEDQTEERRQLQTLLGNMDEGVIMAQGANIVYANRALARLTGYSVEELLKINLDPATHPAALHSDLARLHQNIMQAINQGGIWHDSATLHDKKGESMDVVITGLPIQGLPDRVMLIIRDSSHEKKLRVEKTNFVKNASHELRTPLANLVTRLYLIRRQPEKMEEHIQVMENTLTYMQDLLKEMFEIGLFGRNQIMFDRDNMVLQDVVKEALKSHMAKAELRAIALTVEMPEQPITVFADARRIQQVINYLVSNSMNHTQQNGKVQVRVRLEPPNGGPRMVRLEVEDNGVGLSEEMLTEIFQPFATASMGLVSGTVLGLSLAKEIVERHQGQIEAQSEIGKGTLFIVRLPIIQD
jgi:PAS domain S-box-containing protein